MNTSPSEFSIHEVFSPDLVPLYQLAEQDYQAVINQLSNLMVAIIRHVQQVENPEVAQLFADCAHDILLDYDEDVAERVQWFGRDLAAEESTPRGVASES